MVPYDWLQIITSWKLLSFEFLKIVGHHKFLVLGHRFVEHRHILPTIRFRDRKRPTYPLFIPLFPFIFFLKSTNSLYRCYKNNKLWHICKIRNNTEHVTKIGTWNHEKLFPNSKERKYQNHFVENYCLMETCKIFFIPILISFL